MTELENKIAKALAELLNESQEIQDTETEEILKETVDRNQKKRDHRISRESRRIFRRWRQKSGI